MNRSRRLLLVAAALAPLLAPALSGAQSQTRPPAPQSGQAAAPSTEIKRDPLQHFFTPNLGDLKAELADAKAAGKKAAFVMYMRDDCPYCERMKANILSLPSVQTYFRANFAVLSIDTKGAVPITDFAGQASTEKDFALAQGVRFTPVIMFYDLDGKRLTRVDGEIRTTDEFMALGDYVASESYKSQSFAAYKRSASGKRGG